MLIPIDQDRVAVATRLHGEAPGLRLIDREGMQCRIALRRDGTLRRGLDGALLLAHADGVARVEPEAGWRLSELDSCSVEDGATWNAAFLGLLVEPGSERYARFDVNRAALELEDPGYTEPCDAVLMPDRRSAAVMISRSQKFAVVDPGSGATRLVPLAGRHGSADAIVRGEHLWLTNYDVLCRVGAKDLEVAASPVLQPPFFDPASGHTMGGFIGPSVYSNMLRAWLTPRPYSGDILVVAEHDLRPIAAIPCGGRPYAVAELPDGVLVILDHPFEISRVAHVNQAIDLPRSFD